MQPASLITCCCATSHSSCPNACYVLIPNEADPSVVEMEKAALGNCSVEVEEVVVVEVGAKTSCDRCLGLDSAMHFLAAVEEGSVQVVLQRGDEMLVVMSRKTASCCPQAGRASSNVNVMQMPDVEIQTRHSHHYIVASHPLDVASSARKMIVTSRSTLHSMNCHSRHAARVRSCPSR